MGKIINFEMETYIYNLASKPFRTKKELILLILNTIKIIITNIKFNNPKGKIILKVERMNRLFYEVEDKVFSIQFPFFIQMQDNTTFRIYDNDTGIDIDNKINSLLIGIFEKYDLEIITFEEFFTELFLTADEGENIQPEILWKLIKKLFLFEIGYLRYDYDEKHENGKLHPLNHLDINYDSNSTYKIGLNDKINIEHLIDIVDINSECSFLDIKIKSK